MTLYNYLAQAPHEQLRRIAHEFGLAALSPSKRNLLHTISKRYRDLDFMTEVVQDIPADAKGFLQALVFFTSPAQERFEIPPALLEIWSRETPLRDVLEILQDKGLLFGEISPHHPTVILPGDVRRLLRVLFGTRDVPLHPLDTSPLPDHPLPHGMTDAIFHLLSVLYHHRATLTQKGAVHRRVIERWAERCHPVVAHEVVFDYAFDFCLSRRLIIQTHMTFRPSPGCREWFARDLARIHDELWEHLITRFVLPSKSWQRLLILLASTTAAEESDALRQVFAVAELGDRLHDLPEPDAADFDLTSALRLLGALNILRLQPWPEPETFSCTAEGIRRLQGMESDEPPAELPADACILQPDFQLLIPPTVGYERLWRLEQMAEFRRRDVFTEYRITQNRLLSAMRRGWSREMIFDLLESYTRGRIPENVRISLEEWTGKFGQIKLLRTVLVTCAAKELADEIALIPEIRMMLKDRISERHFAVQEVDAVNLIRLLQDRGYEPACENRISLDDPHRSHAVGDSPD